MWLPVQVMGTLPSDGVPTALMHRNKWRSAIRLETARGAGDIRRSAFRLYPLSRRPGASPGHITCFASREIRRYRIGQAGFEWGITLCILPIRNSIISGSAEYVKRFVELNVILCMSSHSTPLILANDIEEVKQKDSIHLI